MSQAPGPTNPLNDEADIGPFHWPPRAGEGGIRVTVTTSIDVDQQKPKGKDVARTTVKGRKPASVKLVLSWTRQVELDGDAIRIALDPNGENSGKVWEVTHPEANKRGVHNILITKASELTVTGDLFTFTLEADGWTEPTPAAVGGAVTPKTAVPTQYYQMPHWPPLGEIQPGDERLSSVTGQIPQTGFDSPAKKPSAEP